MSKAVVTTLAALLAFAALDDITSDNDTDFVLEQAMVAVSLGWFAFMSLGFVTQGRRWLGAISIVMLAAAVLAQRSIGPGQVPSLYSAHAVALLCLLWFLGVAVWLGVEARRRA